MALFTPICYQVLGLSREPQPSFQPEWSKNLFLRRTSTILIGLGLLGFQCGLPLDGQVLARPGWAGSGVAPESWWPRAVFYRIDPARFQDSDGDGRGDLQGVIERLDYLQSLGVDALVLDSDIDPKDTDALGDLVREASRRQLRVLVTAGPALVQGPREALFAAVRSWLAAGAAGVWVPKASEADNANATYAASVSTLRSMVQSFPGERVLLTDPTPVSLSLAPHPVRLTRRIDPGSFHAARGGQLVTAALFSVNQANVVQLRSSLTAAAEADNPEANSLLRFAQPPDTGSLNAAAYAALLLGSRGAVVLDFGDEIGLDTYPLEANKDAALPVMQWTPSNHTAEAAQAAAKPAGPGAGETVYGTYHPYVPPPRGITGPAPSNVKVSPDMNIPAALPAPDSLPGFTAGTLPSPPVDTDKRNVITEDRDPRSLLNAYRALIALHHGNASLRNGAQAVLNRDADDALVWVRRAPAGTRTVSNVVAAANLSDHLVTLELTADLETAGVRGGGLRPLFTSAPEATTGETTERLLLPPHAVFVGEVYHSGAVGRSEAEPVRRGRHAGRRSRHRVRR